MSHQKDLTSDDFQALAGKTVTVSAETIQIEATLVEIRALNGGLRKGGSFSLLFQGPGSPGLPQAIYRLFHSAIGTQSIFLVPVARTDAGIQYEAVFS